MAPFRAGLADRRRLERLPEHVAMVSYRLGGTDGVSIEAAKWQRALESLGVSVTTVAGAGAADRMVEGLDAGLGRRAPAGDGERAGGLPRPPGERPGAPGERAGGPPRPPGERPGAPGERPGQPAADLEARLAEALDGADLVIVENCCSLPLDPEPGRVLSKLLAGRPAILRHHDLASQRSQLRHNPPPPDDPSWWHVTINERSRLELQARGIEAVTFYNCFDPDPPEGARAATRAALSVDEDEILVVQPTRALRRKNVAGGLRFAAALGATYWLLGPAEDGYARELDRLLELTAGRGRSIFGRPDSGLIEDAYAAADMVVMPSTWEGFGNPSIESAFHRKPLAIADYPVAVELRRFGFSWFDVAEPERAARFLAAPDVSVLDRNEQVARMRFSTSDLPERLRALITGG